MQQSAIEVVLMESMKKDVLMAHFYNHPVWFMAPCFEPRQLQPSQLKGYERWQWEREIARASEREKDTERHTEGKRETEGTLYKRQWL